MIIFGFGNDDKVLADAGMMKCRNCKNFSFFSLYEAARKFTLYFIKVARYEKKYFVVCETCTAGFELTEQLKNDMLTLSLALPSRDAYGRIWQHLDQGLKQIAASGLDVRTEFDRIRQALYTSYPPQHVELVAQTLVRCLTDEDPPQ